MAVVSPFVDRRHGTERALAELLERLARTFGCKIHLYAQRVDDLCVGTFDSSSLDREAAGDPPSGTIYWHKVPAIPGPHVVQFLGWMMLNALWRKRDAWFGRPPCDLLLSPGINCLRPDVVIVHALFHRLRELSEGSSGELPAHNGILRRSHRRLYYALLAILERSVYGHRKIRLVAVSQRTADLLKHHYGRENVPVVSNGVDVAHFRPEERLARRAQARQSRGFHNEDCVLLLIGNDWRNKGLPTVLDAMATLPELPLRLVVVGNDEPVYFQKKAAQLTLQHRCLWEQPRPDVMELYAAADVYVSPSREDSFGMPVAEAMACGLPVITSKFAGVAELLRHGVDGFVLEDPHDTAALAQLLVSLASNPELRRNIGVAAARSAADWSWDRHAARVWELLRSQVQDESNP